MKTQRGFSLVELMIVIAIIGIIAAIAVPSLLLAERRAREASAVNCLRAYSSAQLTFYATTGGYLRYGTVPELANGFMDPSLLSSGVRNAYTFTFSLGPGATTFTAAADPQLATPDARHFYLDSSGVITYLAGAPANAGSTVLGS